MLVSDSVAVNIVTLAIKTVKAGIKAVSECKKKHAYIPKYYQYPDRILKGFEDKEEYSDIVKKCDIFKYGIPFFRMSQYNDYYNYGALFTSYEGHDNIFCPMLDGFNELLVAIQEDSQAKSRFAENEDNLQNALISFIRNIVNRYFYITDASAELEIDESIVKKLVFQQLDRLIDTNLNVHICIPICCVVFDCEDIKITDTISICKMSEDFQTSRFNASRFESTPECNYSQCASFMIRLDNYSFDNKSKDTFHFVTKDPRAFPITVINDLFAAIRIVTGVKTGYGQLLIEPTNWAEKWTGNLLPVYGTNSLAFNRNDAKLSIFEYGITVINQPEIDSIRDVFTTIQANREKGKNTLFNKVFIAVERLNRCMLREEDDDTSLDAIIGIETLLSGDTRGEITYTISNRMAVVAAKTNECPYSAADARKEMKKIYSFRSSIVHGRDTQKSNKVNIGEERLQTTELAINFLRYSLLFIIRNQEYLDVKEFEKAIDEALVN